MILVLNIRRRSRLACRRESQKCETQRDSDIIRCKKAAYIGGKALKSLLKEMKYYKKETVLAPFFKMLEALFDLFVPLVMKKIIDIGIGGNDMPYIVKMCLLLVLIAVVSLLWCLVAQYFAANAAVGFAARLRSKVFSHIQKLSYTELDRAGASTLITRMTSDINQIQNAVNLTLRLFLRSPFIVFGSMVMAFTISVKAGLIFLVTIPLLGLVVFLIMRITQPMHKDVQSVFDHVTEATRENLTGVRVLRAFNREDSEFEAFEKTNGELKTAQLKVGKVSAFLNPVTYVIINIATAVLIYVGAISVSKGNLSQGAVIALVNYMGQILVELVKLANLIVSMARAAASGDRVEKVLETGGKESFGTRVSGDETAAAVAFSNVSFCYDGSKEESLSNISFIANRGETIGVIGATGSGKTTLVSLIPGFYPATKGEVLIDGKPVADYDPESLRKRIASVSQKAVLFSGTVRSNLLMGDEEASDEMLLDALKKAQAYDFVEEKGGLDAEVEQEGRNFSGGQKQRLSIARALIRKPDILILDDSLSALDFQTDAALRSEIRKMARSMTIFIVSQRAASLMACDRILVLEDGRTAGYGTHDELLTACEVYREIYESQFKI